MPFKRIFLACGFLASLSAFSFVPVSGAGSAPAALAAVQPVAACGALAAADLKAAAQSDVTITSAGPLATSAGDFCQILGVIAPAIHFEVDLPQKNWTQRYLQVGCGGLCGTLSVRVPVASDCQPVLHGEFAVASDDMGHQGGGDASFGTDPQKRIDFAYRGNHVTALVAKALIQHYYGQAPRYSYFSGCSDGGREALVEAERYPADFDGVAAGAPALNLQVQNTFYHAWMARANTGPDGKPILFADRLPILHRAVVAACDDLDGQKDGILSDPRLCHFDPGAIQCAAGAPTDNCLAPAEVAVARKFYAGPVDEKGVHLTIAGPQYGSELAWAGVYVMRSADERTFSENIASGSLHYLAFPEISAVDGDLAQFGFTAANFRRLEPLHHLYDANNTDLSGFQKRGGRLILWHGWGDQHISPINTIAYYRAVQKQMGTAAANGFLRLFLFAGMYHCNGGEGFTQFDMLTPLMAWVENGNAPDRIVAGQVAAPPPNAGGPPRAAGPVAPARQAALAERPVFAYPMQARYSGTGDVNAARNYVAQPQAYREPERYDWAGAPLLGPDNQLLYAVQNGALIAQH